MGIKRKLSTAYHPETDGKTERSNQSMKIYLRHYVNQQQTNWISLLPMAQIAINNRISESTGVSPYYAYHGKHMSLFERDLPTNINSEKASATAERIQKTHHQLRDNLKKSQDQMISYQNKKKKNGPQLERGDKVYLLTKNLRTQRPSKKLDHVKVGPFLIAAQRGPVNYELELPPDAKIHPVFHVKYLEPADPSTPVQTTFNYETEEEDTFVVERIIRHRQVNANKEYLIKWKGYPNSENTWEPEEHLTNCQIALTRYSQGKK